MKAPQAPPSLVTAGSQGLISFQVVVNGSMGKATQTDLVIATESVSYLKYVIGVDIIESVSVSSDGGDKSRVLLLKYEGRSTPKRITFDNADSTAEAVRMIQSCLSDYQATPAASRPRTKSVLPARGGEDDDESAPVASAAVGKPLLPAGASGQKARSDAPQLQGGGSKPGAKPGAAAVAVGGAAAAAAASGGNAGELMYSGCICCYSAFNFDKIFVLCKGSSTCICIEQKQCLAAGEPTFPVGLIQEEGFICKLGLPCCTYGLKMPDTNDLISSDAVCLCARSVAQFPFGDKSTCKPLPYTHPTRSTQRNARMRKPRVHVRAAFLLVCFPFPLRVGLAH